MESLYVLPISSAVKLGAIKLLKSCLSSASSFYMHLLRTSNVKTEKKTLFGHVASFINSKNISLSHVLLNDNVNIMKRRLCQTKINNSDGLIDSLRLLIADYSQANREMVQLILKTIKTQFHK